MASKTEAEARAIVERVLRMSKADGCEVDINARTDGNIRFARNSVSTAGGSDNVSVSIQSFIGKKSGTTTVNELDDASLEKAVRRSEELARLSPDDPEQMPPLGKQEYLPVNGFVQRTADVTPEDRANVAAACLAPAKAKGCTAAGFLEDNASASAFGTSAGCFAYHRQTRGEFTLTVRTDDGLGSGYAAASFDDFRDLDAGTLSGIALEKAVASREAKAVEPGKYTVVLEPLAVSGILGFMVSGFDARQAEEGRSWVSTPGGGTRLGERFFDERVNLFSDPQHAGAAGRAWAGDGQALGRTDWIKDGKVNALSCSRYWAQKTGRQPLPGGSNIIMSGGDASTEELIRGTARGILVTRTWYIRSVDPQTLLVTGLTRDGTFYIEDGRIKHAVKNFRFNESPIIMLNNLDALGRTERVSGGGRTTMVPAMRVRDFTFSSLSDAV